MADAPAADGRSSSSGSGGDGAQEVAAALRELGAALRLEAQPGLVPELQELISSWALRAQAVVDAADSAEGGLAGEVAAAAADELLRPLLSGALAATTHPDLLDEAVDDAIDDFYYCGSADVPCQGFFVAVANGLLELFLNGQLSTHVGGIVAQLLLMLMDRPGCAAALLAAPAEGAVEAFIAVAQREEEPYRSNAYAILAQLAAANADAAERAASALLPLAVERLRSGAAAGAASRITAAAMLGPVRLLYQVTLSAPAAARATPALAGAAVGLLMALGSEEWAATREEVGVTCDRLEADLLLMLAALLQLVESAYPLAFQALASHGALPRVLALLRSPSQAVRCGAAVCISMYSFADAGAAALLKAPRAAAELTAALRRAHADGEDPALLQSHAAASLANLALHSEGQRVVEALNRAAAAEGSAGSLLAALVGLLAACADGGSCMDIRWAMCFGSAFLLGYMTAAATAEQLRVLRRAPRLAEACVRALLHWVPQAVGDQLDIINQIAFALAIIAGFDDWREGDAGASRPPPAATADTAAVRAALQTASGLEGTLRRCLDWGGGSIVSTAPAVKWLLRLPEVKAAAPAAAAVSAAAAAAAAPGAAGPAPVDPTAAPASEAAAPAAAGERAEPRAGSSGASGSSGSGSGAESAARPRVCGGCGNSAAEAPLLRCVGCKAQYYCGDACALRHWPSHRAACKAARAAARAAAA
ncbi:hypothetical protein Rsub_12319 [Raphidocelis subcapitata]|uniref:MYND-type domain-containing protein n=1 Tax=Raphidocelis subcapitata TaxID=307507 RepID=A0A2V0PI23_9CHLO|nr:hypothetical protein Rsub_12319 [Raphidocelis subcapitata]|eukprot:GBF99386.1 hypothetical protein Rsub_12319 [Raphidocelis subcapitata]